MFRYFFITALAIACAVLTGIGGIASAQAPHNVPRIGVLVQGIIDKEYKRDLHAFMQGFKELGWVVGKNILLEYRAANRKIEDLPRLAAQLVQLDVPVMVVVGPTAVDAAFRTTRAIPIVMISGGDPVNRGFVKSLAMPGGNVTGLSSNARGDEGKRLELLKDLLPQSSRVIILNMDRLSARAKSYLTHGQQQGIAMDIVHAYNVEDLKPAFDKIAAQHPNALITVRSSLSIQQREQIADFALKQRLPAIYESREFVEIGGLMSFGVDYTASWHRAPYFIDKLLKGANPALLPIEPPKFEFVLNLKTANKMQLSIPPQILLEAKEVIK